MPVYMKIEGIPGESKAANHVGEIELESFSWSGATNNAILGPAGFAASKFTVDGLHITKQADLTTLPLMQRMATGKPVGKVQMSIDVTSANKTVTLVKYFLGGVFATDLDQSYSSSDSVPTETFKLKFTQIFVEYYQVNAMGQVVIGNKAGWDFAKNLPLSSPP